MYNMACSIRNTVDVLRNIENHYVEMRMYHCVVSQQHESSMFTVHAWRDKKLTVLRTVRITVRLIQFSGLHLTSYKVYVNSHA